MEDKVTHLYHPPEAVDTPPVGRVEGINEFGAYVVRTQVLDQRIPNKVVYDGLPFFDRRAGRAFDKAVDQARFHINMVLEQPDTRDLL